MSSDGKALMFTAATLGAGVAALAGWNARWSSWPVFLLVPVLLGVFLLMGRRTPPVSGDAAGPSSDYEPYVSRQQPQDRENSVSNIHLPSAVPNYDFLFAATVRWRPIVTPGAATCNANPAARAIDAILAQARQITVTEQPSAFTAAQLRLSSELGDVTRDPTGQVEAWATGVSLTLADSDLNRLRKIAALLKDEEVWEHERAYERSKRAYLSDEVLKTTGSAVVWWLARQDKNDDVQRTVDLIGQLAQLAAAANDSEVPDVFRHLVPSYAGGKDTGDWGAGPDDPGASPNGFHYGATLLSEEPAPPDPVVEAVSEMLKEAGIAGDDPRRPLFAKRVADAFRAAGKPGAEQRIREVFDAPHPDPETDDPSAAADDDEPPAQVLFDLPDLPDDSEPPDDPEPPEPWDYRE